MFLSTDILAESLQHVPGHTAAYEEGARIFGGKNMKTLGLEE